MKALKIGIQFYYYPPECNNIDEFINYLNHNYNSFIPLTQLLEENCVEPYFIKEDVLTTYLNVAQINMINEVEITVLSRKEYFERLKDVVNSKCVHCKNFIDDGGYDIESHSDSMSLDGKCIFFEKADD